MRTTYVYRPDELTGRPRAIPVTGGICMRHVEHYEESFEHKMMKNLYDLECRDGARFDIDGISKKNLHRIWTDPRPDTEI